MSDRSSDDATDGFDASNHGEAAEPRWYDAYEHDADHTPDQDLAAEPEASARPRRNVLRHRGLQKAAGLTALVVVTAASTGAVVHAFDGNSATTVKSTVATVAKTNTTTTNGISAALTKITPSVVIIKDTITTANSSNGGFGGPGSFGNGQSTSSAAGTGIIVSSNGLVLTNAHVVNGATNIQVTLADGKTHSATIVGLDATKDLAVIKVAGVSGLTPATFAKSADVAVGDSVIAVGNAEDLGSTPSVTEGIISAKNRSLTDSSESLSGLLQTDAAISPGNSGGPLVDTTGNVVGMNTAVETGTSSEPAANIGFAIASDTITSELATLESGKMTGSSGSGTNSNHGFLGVSVSDNSAGGALIDTVESGSPASSAGLQAGDVVTAVGSTSVGSASDLVAALSQDPAGTSVVLTITRNGTNHNVRVTLGTESS